MGGEALVQWKEGRKKYCFDCWWCNIDHLQFLCFNPLLYVFQMKTYTDDDWFLIWLFPLHSELFYLGFHATDITFLCLNLRFGLQPKYLTPYPNCIHFFSKTLYQPFFPFPSHFYISLFLCPCLAARQLFLAYYLNCLGYFYFFHLAILPGWSLKILDNCQGFLDIW